MISNPCFARGASIEGEDLAEYGLVGLAHVRAEHADTVPYPDMAVGVPQNSACYCLEPHEVTPGEPLPEFGHWTERRAAMIVQALEPSLGGGARIGLS